MKRQRAKSPRRGKGPLDAATGQGGETATSGEGASFPVVGVGASAGGLEAFTNLLRALPRDTGMAFVLVQHLDPEHESALTQILSRVTVLPVTEIRDGQRVEANHVHVIPRDTNLLIARGVLKLEPRPRTRAPHRPIDLFFESLAQDQRERAIGVVLSGTASDGTLGLEAIKAEGGITFAQDDSAKFDSMPRSAIAAGVVDLVLAPADIAGELTRIARHPYGTGRVLDVGNAGGGGIEEHHAHAPPRGPSNRTAAAKRVRADDNGYRKIMLLLRSHSGVDFSLYRSATIQRRIARRLVLTKYEALDDYAGFLKGNAQELDALYSDVLISVTSFFRNPEAFDVLQRVVLPELLRQRTDDPVRCWVLGCSTGQEAYSIAIAFAEAAERAPRMRRLQVFATDLNEKLLDKARHGLYARSLADDVSPERLRRFFVEEEGGYRVVKGLRDMVVFARQNLINDPPFSRMDVISCRNLLIYLEPTLQHRALPTFHYALKPGGFLMLGASESIGSFTELFETVDKKHKIYSKKPAPTPVLHLLARKERAPGSERPAPGPDGPPALPVERPQPAVPEPLRGELSAQREADRIAVNQFAPPGVLINDRLQILQFRGPTAEYLAAPAGRASFDVLKWARDGLMLPLRAAIGEARKKGNTVRRPNVRVRRRSVTLIVMPLKNLPERCYLILFEEADRVGLASPPPPDAAPDGPPLRRAAERIRVGELEAELAEAREYLQSVQEQHEASSEELQAANEEVQSANEELQSINEELETSKEELESTNEELQTVNDEMGYRNTELTRLNNDLVNLQSSIKTAIVLLGRDLRIRRFSLQAETLLDLQATDVGRPIRQVRHDLRYEPSPAGRRPGEGAPVDLETLAVEVITTMHEQEREVRHRDTRWYSLRVRPYLTTDNRVDGAVLVLVDIDDLKRAGQAVAAARDYAESTVETVREPLLVLDQDLRVESANRSFYRTFRVSAADTVGRFIYDLGNRQWDIPRLRELLESVLPERTTIENYEVEHHFESIGLRTMLLNARQLFSSGGTARRILLAIDDITERIRAEAASAHLAAIVTSSEDAVISKTLDGVITSWNRGAQRLFGYTAEEAIGQPVTMLIPEDHRGEEREILERIRGGAAVEAYQTVRQRKDGTRLDVSLAISPVRDAAGRVIGASKVARDITQLKVAEQALRAASRAKDEFLAMLGHELRNPLDAISSAAHLLGDAAGPDAAAARARAVLERQLAHLTRLVDDLLDLGRVTAGKIALRLRPVDLAEVAGEVVSAWRASGRLDRHEVAVEAASAWVEGDETRLEQIVVNLLGNALKFTPAGGTVRLRVGVEGRDAILEVEDTGAGIAPEVIGQVFELFAQGAQSPDRAQGGLGLGLTLVRRLVEGHGGTVTARSGGVGRGSVFTVRVPAIAPPPQEARPASDRGRSKPRRILLIEDSDDSREMLRLILEREGHSVVEAVEGQEGIDLATAAGPDIALIDIGLPGLDGYEVARRIRAARAATPITLVALTGYGQADDRRRAEEAGFDLHLVKPVDPLKVADIIASL